MTNQERLNLIKLEDNINKMMNLIRHLEEEKSLLNQRLVECENSLEVWKKRYQEAERLNKMLQTAQTLSGDMSGVANAKAHIKELIKEVDKCIALIKTE